MVTLPYGPVVCLVDLPVTLHFSACTDEDLEKYVLETLKLCCTMFKRKCPADTEDEALFGISSEDEAENLDLDPAITHRAVRQGAPAPIVGTSAVPSAEVNDQWQLWQVQLLVLKR